MAFSYERSFVFEFDSSLSSADLGNNYNIANMNCKFLDSNIQSLNVEFAKSDNNKTNLLMKNGIYYSIPSDPNSSIFYFGPYPDSQKGLDWIFGISYYSNSLGRVSLNGELASKFRHIAGHFKTVYDSIDRTYNILNNNAESKYSEFVIFESGESETQNAIHLWIRKKNEETYYKYKTENYDNNQWINLLININQPAVWNSGFLSDPPSESFELRFYVNCRNMSFFSYGEEPELYRETMAQYLNINNPSSCYDFSINDRIFGHESQIVQLSSAVDELYSLNRRKDGYDDTPYFSENNVFDSFNYGFLYTLGYRNKVSNSSFITKTLVQSTISVNASEGSSEGQYLGLSDGRLIESKESVWQYLKLLNSNISLQSINVINLTNNANVEVINGSGIKFTGNIVELE